MSSLTANFSVAEMQCKCGCETCEMDPEFMDILQNIREDIGKPMKVTSGFRCMAHNQAVSHSGKAGPHTTGKAADIQISGHDAFDLIEIAQAHGITGIGLDQKGDHNRRYIHLDALENGNGRPRPWVWTY